jgi:hypothetical protein
MTTKAKSDVFEKVRSAIDIVLDYRLESEREVQARSFLRSLAYDGIRLSEFEKLAGRLPARGAGSGGPSSRDMYSQLDAEERLELQQYVNDKAQKLKRHFPELGVEFKEQFS